MKLKDLELLVKASPAHRIDYLKSFYQSDRNTQIKIHKDYYDGKHWDLEDVSESTNTTRSGKVIWGKKNNYHAEVDKLGRQKNKSRSNVEFHGGQLQVRNYIKNFIHTYIDYISGGDNDKIIVELKESDESTQDYIDSVWCDIKEFLKIQLTKMVLTTVAIAEVGFDGEDVAVNVVDASEVIPVYKQNKIVGVVRTYPVSPEYARLYNVVQVDDKESVVTYADIYYTDENNDTYFGRLINGILLDFDGNPTTELQKLLFPIKHFIVSNINHPDRKFSETELEDSEIFSWIDKNDSLNANETIAFITNQYLAMPKIQPDFELMVKMGKSIDDPEIRQALMTFQYFPGSIDSLPIKVAEGHTIPDSFYMGMDRIVQSMFEDAGIPRFVVSGEGLANISEQTMLLGMSMLERKISEKRQQLSKLIRDITIFILKSKGYISQDVQDKDIEIDITYPSINPVSVKDFINYIITASDKNLLPYRYTQQELLKSIGKGDDIEIVKEIENIETYELTSQIDKEKANLRAELERKEEELEESKNKEKIKELDYMKSELEVE